MTAVYLRQFDSPVITKMTDMVPGPLLGQESGQSKKDLAAGSTERGD